MSSFDIGKDKVVEYLVSHDEWRTALDVGACDGKWKKLLGDRFEMDAVEVFHPNIINHRLCDLYRNVFWKNIVDFDWYTHYDVIIFGDVIEHLSVEDARKVIGYAWPRCHEMIVSVPFKFKQGAIYGNDYERHIQDDLTHDLFMERYHGFEVLHQEFNYCYYKKRRKDR